MPPESPRPFRWGALRAKTFFCLLFGGIWAGVGGGVLAVFLCIGQPFWVDLALDRSAQQATGTPTAVVPTRTRINRVYVQEISYTFTTAAGATGAGTCGTTNAELIAQAKRLEPLAIEFDPARPEISRIRGERLSLFGWFTLIPFPIALIGLVILGFGLRGALSTRRIYIDGVAVQATVTGTRRTGMRINRKTVSEVAYSFPCEAGTATGTTTSTDPPDVGTQIWILYDPLAPERNVVA